MGVDSSSPKKPVSKVICTSSTPGFLDIIIFLLV